MVTVHDADLAPYTTFGVHGRVPLLITVETESELVQSLRDHPDARILGGGSNVLVPNQLTVPVIRISIKGRTSEHRGNDVVITLGAGEIWHDTVSWCVKNNWGGLENLAYIPGTVGAAPIQNIGAYGVEQGESFVELTAVDRKTLQHVVFNKEQCRFAYRNSIFKTDLSNTLVITTVTYCLSTPPHSIHASYKDVAEELSRESRLLAEGASAELTIADIYEAVISIRRRKLPNPTEIGNAGSFFKNPVIVRDVFDRLQTTYPDIPSYPQQGDGIKVPAAWLIDKCGWKGYNNGKVGVHQKQALVLVNTGNASGSDVLALSKQIQASVSEHFGIMLEPEVNIW